MASEDDATLVHKIRGASRSSTQNQRSTLYRAELIRRTFGTFYVAIVDAEPKDLEFTYLMHF